MREKAVNLPGLEPKITLRPPKRQISTPSRHSLKCAICNHPDRAAIEFDFLNWRNPGDLVKSYHFRGLSTVYRHAHATGLLAKRRLNLRFAMERIVERVSEVPVTATSVIRAARAISRINDSGQWVDPPSRVIVTHIHAEDSSFVGAPLVYPDVGRAAPATALEAKTSRGTGSQPVDSSVEVSSGDSQARAGTEAFVGRGGTCPDRSVGNRDKKPRSSHSSLRACQAGQGDIPDIAARERSAVSRAPVIFDKELLDEPSESASAELPRTDGKPAPPEIILELSPEFARCREERNRAIEADRQANESAHANGSSGTGSQPVHDNSERRSASGLATNPETVPSPTRREEQSVASSSSLLPQAALDNEETSPDSALCGSGLQPRHNARLSGVSFRERSEGRGAASTPLRASFGDPLPAENPIPVAPSSLPQAEVSAPATACPEQGRGAQQSPRAAGPPLGSSGSADPPFPFTPKPSPRWNPRRRF
ncbi:MAG TPA: hypothetical protein VGR72_00470 [Candidatus Acidoferrales bacterium]|nr:hypothetical protein [Candidatus Acidoferrales bacterium]